MNSTSASIRQQLRAFWVAVWICAAISFCFSFVSIQTTVDSEHIGPDSKINPNDAPLGSLINLPGIGMARAAAVIAYRQQRVRSNGVQPAFRNSEDLQKVKGIGPVTAAKISEWLKFD